MFRCLLSLTCPPVLHIYSNKWTRNLWMQDFYRPKFVISSCFYFLFYSFVLSLQQGLCTFFFVCFLPRSISFWEQVDLLDVTALQPCVRGLLSEPACVFLCYQFISVIVITAVRANRLGAADRDLWVGGWCKAWQTGRLASSLQTHCFSGSVLSRRVSAVGRIHAGVTPPCFILIKDKQEEGFVLQCCGASQVLAFLQGKY